MVLGPEVNSTVPRSDDVAPSSIVPDETWSAALVSFSFCLAICDPLIAPAMMPPIAEGSFGRTDGVLNPSGSVHIYQEQRRKSLTLAFWSHIFLLVFVAEDLNTWPLRDWLSLVSQYARWRGKDDPPVLC